MSVAPGIQVSTLKFSPYRKEDQEVGINNSLDDANGFPLET